MVELTENLQAFATGLPTSGLATVALVKLMIKLVETSKLDKKNNSTAEVYQFFVESMKYIFAQRSSLGDLTDNEYTEEITSVISL